ncbi:MAG: hypothetical protein ACHQ0J_13535 [Candidatus Dormibacterales bacterium]
MGVAFVAAPLTVAAAQDSAAPVKGLVLAPGLQIAAVDVKQVDFLLVNTSSAPFYVTASSSDAWLVPAEKSFTILPGQRHSTSAALIVPLLRDAGDHESDVTFLQPPAATGQLRVSWGLAARVIISTGGVVAHDLHLSGLTVPAIADSFEQPTINLTARNAGNVHELITVAPFGQMLLLRGQTRTVSLLWTQHPWIGWGEVSAGGLKASTLFLPWKLLAALFGLFCGWLLWRQLRPRPKYVAHVRRRR